MTAESNNIKKNFKHKKLVIVLSVILAVIICFISAYFIIIKVGEAKLRKKLNADTAKLPVNDSDVLPEDADAYYNGAAYNYNEKLINILLIGVDNRTVNTGQKHQADALYLISLDPDSKAVNVIAISRNTLAEMDICDSSGQVFSTAKQQLCLSYSYGINHKQSSELACKAVSNFLYGVPINGYYTIFMNSIKDIVNSVGGVPVHITEDLTSVNSKFKAGSDVTVTGDTVLAYLRHRGESNEPRLERQKVFILSFVSQAKKAVLKDLSLPSKMYNKLAAHTVTDVSAASAVYLASEALNADFRLLNIAGATGSDGFYETFTADEEQLYSLLIDVFYKKQ